MLRWLGPGLLLVVLPWAGVAGIASAQGTAAFDGQYAGELTLAGIVDGDCTQPPLGAIYPLTIAGGEVSFAYVPRFNTTLRGRVRENGRFRASARVHGGNVVMTGRVSGGHLTADLVSPSCRYKFHTQN